MAAPPRPARTVTFAFLGTALGGTLLLSLPIAVIGEPLPFVDRVFTAVSATCVTGLVVADTGTRFTPFGQGVIAVLIQLGGLGIMTFSSVLLLAIGQRISFRERTVIRNTLSGGRARSLGEFVRYVVSLALTIEVLGALLLSLRLALAHGVDPGSAIGHGTFLAISAFCSAGFAPWPDSLAGYRDDPLLMIIVMALIVIGGLGFVVLVNLRSRWMGDEEGNRQRLSLHSRLVLTTTAVLLVAGFVGFVGFEWRAAALGELPTGERVLACLFQSVTPRTAGFSVVDPAALTMPSIFLTMLLMLIGAAPGSTGGGLKVTTVAILWALVRARYRGRERVNVFDRTLPEPTVNRALAAAFAGNVSFLLILFALLVAQQATSPRAGAAFLPEAFEAISALGTVGLSLGLTPELSAAGRWVIIIAMFIGRLGPLTLALAVARVQRGDLTQLAEEEVMVG